MVTILALQGHQQNRQLFNGVKKTLARKLNPRGKRTRIVHELKGSSTTLEVKKYFYAQVADIDFKTYSIVLNKQRVYESLAKNQPRESDNYISRVLLEKVPVGDATTQVNFIIDKSKSKP